jgi:predicted transcriptional regulator
MKDVKFRIDDELHQQLQELAAREGETMSVIARRYVRRGVRTDVQDVPGLARAHEGAGRVR